MGSLILCHKKRARRPFEISRVHMRIYTIEELCYYICNNLYLIDYTIVNERLCKWIADELELTGLADELREKLRDNCSMEDFILTILKKSDIYAATEINKMQNVLEKLQSQRDVEKEKYKADSLQNSKEYEAAILVYQSIINKEWDESVDRKFYGKVYASMAAAYGHQFLYEEAAKAYQEAYKICEEQELLKAYLYSCYRAMPGEEYEKLLSGNPVLSDLDTELKEQIERTKKEIGLEISEEKLEEWKKDYRRIDKQQGIC